MHGSRLVAKAARGGNTGELIRNTTSPFGLVHIMLQHDTVPERLRRWTRNPLGSARRGSNPLGVDLLLSRWEQCACVTIRCSAIAAEPSAELADKSNTHD